MAATLAPVSERCAYCEAPLASPAAAVVVRQPDAVRTYCCYGCRLLGERGEKPLPESEIPAPWFKVGLGAAISGQAMLLGLAVNLSAPEGFARHLLHLVLILSAVGVFALLGGPLLETALSAVRRRRVTVEFLFLAGTVGAFGASLYSTVANTGAVYYEVVAVLLTVYTVSKTLTAHSRARALGEARRLRETFDTCRLIGAEGRYIHVSVAQVESGDRVSVFAGEGIPVDGRVEDGSAFVRELPLTGEPFPVVRRPGDAVLAGSFSEDGELRIVATCSGRHRRLDGLLASVEAARNQSSDLQAQADRLVQWFLPLVLGIAAASFVYWTWRGEWATGLFNGLAVLLVACPCGLGLATPLAIWNGLAVLASRGFVVRDSSVLGRLAGLTHLVFDKTGTLSEEQASLIDLACRGSATERVELRRMLAAIQARSRHPVALAFQAAHGEAGLAIQVVSCKQVPARGIEAWVGLEDGREIHVRLGQRELMTALPGEAELLGDLQQAPGDQLVYVETDGRLAAIASVRERLRGTVGETFSALEALGVRWSVLSGDRPERVAGLGLPSAQGGLTPLEKANAISRMAAEGERVGFVGDGVNDAPALQAAGAGIALAHGAGVATANADAVLHGGDLRTVAWAIAVARRVRDSIQSNLWFAAVYNFLGVLLAATGYLHPVVAALLMVGSSGIVSWRALRATREVELCCLPATPLPGPSSGGWATWRWNWIFGGLQALQGPFLVYLGAIEGTARWLTLVGCALLGWGIARFRTRSREGQRYAEMTSAMLGLGNWGMILGWWMEAGFSQVIIGASCCHGGVSAVKLAGWSVPWMYVGMLVLGLPPMVAEGAPGMSWLARWSTALLSATGMCLGMAYGSWLALRWFGPEHPQAFLMVFGGMTLGMMLGMFLFCELGRLMARQR